MSVNIEGSALSIPKSLDSLKTTPSAMHRIWFELLDTKTWYKIISEANQQFASNWRGQPHVKRKLEGNKWNPKPIKVWFDVPDERFGTWCAVKYAVTVAGPGTK